MKSFNNAFKEKDEYYTPFLLIEFLYPVLKEKDIKTILCPFDNKNSNYVKFLKKKDLMLLVGILIKARIFLMSGGLIMNLIF